MKKSAGLIGILMLMMSVGLWANGEREISFPDRSVQSFFPWGPGTTYAVSQIVASDMSNHLGENVVVTNATGAGGVKAAMTVLGKAADGYSIFDASVAPLILSPLFGKADYNYKDWKPLYGVLSNAFAVVVRADDTRFPELPDLLEFAQMNPGVLKYAAGAEITLPHMTSAAMLKTANAVCRYVPYNDTNDGIKDLLSGELDFNVINSGAYEPYKGQVRVLGVLSDMPQPGFPGEKLISDYGIRIGLDGLAATGWTWWLVRKETPDEVVEILRAAMKKAMDNPEVIEKISAVGYVPLPTSDFNPDTYEDVCSTIEAQLMVALDAITWEKEEITKY